MLIAGMSADKLERTLNLYEDDLKRRVRRMLYGRLEAFEEALERALPIGVVPLEGWPVASDGVLSVLESWIGDVYRQGYQTAVLEVPFPRIEVPELRLPAVPAFPSPSATPDTPPATQPGTTPPAPPAPPPATPSVPAATSAPSPSEHFVPTDAVAWARGRTTLQGKWSRDLDAEVSEILAKSLEEGLTTEQTMARLKELFKDFSDARLENIARTETTAAFNAGRWNWFRSLKGYVVAVQYVAILDGRTTVYCRARHGRIMLLEDPHWDGNVPPTHFFCRGIVSPITKREWKKLQDGDQDALRRTLGWTTFTTLTEAMDWSAVPPAMPGFGRLP